MSYCWAFRSYRRYIETLWVRRYYSMRFGDIAGRCVAVQGFLPPDWELFWLKFVEVMISHIVPITSQFQHSVN